MAMPIRTHQHFWSFENQHLEEAGQELIDQQATKLPQ